MEFGKESEMRHRAMYEKTAILVEAQIFLFKPDSVPVDNCWHSYHNTSTRISIITYQREWGVHTVAIRAISCSDVRNDEIHFQW